MLKADIQILSGKSEVVYPLQGFVAPAGAYLWFTVCEIKQKRSVPVRLRLVWQKGSSQGSQVYTIIPQQDNSVL